MSTVKMRFPDPYHEQHWHECPKHLHSHHLDPHGLQQTTQMKNQIDWQLVRDLFNVSNVCFSASYVSPDTGKVRFILTCFSSVWDNYASDVLIIRVWLCHLDNWLSPRIILTYNM